MLRWFTDNLTRWVFKLEDKIISNITLNSELDTNAQEDIMLQLIDHRNERFEQSFFENESFSIWEKTPSVEEFLEDVETKHRHWVIPNFLAHFDFRGVSDTQVLYRYVRFQNF